MNPRTGIQAKNASLNPMYRQVRRPRPHNEGKRMFGLKVREVMERKQLLTAPPDMTVSQAAKLMASRNVGAVMVTNDTKLVGIFTERDALFRVTAKGLLPEATPLSDVMTAAPQTVDPEKTMGYALLLMSEKGFRHVPVVEHGKLIGIVSARHALDPELEEFVAEVQRREQIQREYN